MAGSRGEPLFFNYVRDMLPSAERTEALKFLIHFVGDIHQPLHVSHARDRGGNDIKVEFFHDRTNLHRMWDSGLIRRTKYESVAMSFSIFFFE